VVAFGKAVDVAVPFGMDASDGLMGVGVGVSVEFEAGEEAASAAGTF
jgi:hypothetical protein